MREKITKRAIEAIEPSVRDTFLWDAEIPGFGCKMTPKGGRIYLLQYSLADRDHRITIGRHGVEFTAEQARNEARRLRGLIAAGQNPSQIRSQERTAPIIAALGERYLDEYAKLHKKPAGLAQDKRNLDNHIIPLIGRLKVSEVERQDISRVMRDIAAGKTAKDEKTKHQGRRIVRGGEIVANRVHALLSKMFQLAEDWNYRPAGSNPCRGAKRFAEHKVERFLSVDEFARLGRALDAAKRGQLIVEPIPDEPPTRVRGGQKKVGPRFENPHAVAAIELLLLTGCRAGEVLNSRWGDVDLANRRLLLPDSKTGAASGLSLPMIGALLGHSQPATTARYAHLAASPLHQAVDEIGTKISQAMKLPA
jgi:integrase